MELFHCDRQRMRLTVAGCAKLWTSAKERRPEPWEGRRNCVNCPIGAANAGQTVPEIKAAALAEGLRQVCPACSRKTDRLINGERCVSCYNRRRECDAGVNAKGGIPRLISMLHTERLVAEAVGGVLSTMALEGVASRTEAMILAAKRAGGAVTFQRAPLSLPAGCVPELPL